MSSQDEFIKVAQALDNRATLVDDPLVSAYLESEAESFRKLGDLGDDQDAMEFLFSEAGRAEEVAAATEDGYEFLSFFMAKE